jgi:hypothetical protein
VKRPGDGTFCEDCYSTVIVKVALWVMDPEVAVTVAEVVVDLVEELFDEPPHAVNKLSAAKLTANNKSSCSRFLFLNPMRQNATARVAAGNSGDLSCSSLAAVDAEIESEVEVDPPSKTVIGLGLKVQL